MAAASPLINVYAPLPLSVALDANLNTDPTNWRWVHCLSLPLETLNEFSHRPYKWISYAIGVVVGAQGVLSTSPDFPNAPTADHDDLYYHITNEERRRMFPVDPRGRSDFTSSVHTPLKDDFWRGVAERDGNCCILTEVEEVFCDAVHLMSQSKGDGYISTYTRRRSRDPAGDDIIQETANIRNGIFISNAAHRLLGKDIAFLKTPNFAMDTSDIDLTASSTEKRCTVHIFDEHGFPAFKGLSGSSIQIPDTPETPGPPAILFDAGYATAVLHHFGTQTLKDHLTATWKDTFSSKEIVDGRELAVERKEIRDQKRYEASQLPDKFDLLMAIPYILVPPDELKRAVREARERAEAAEQRQVQEKVNAWMTQVTAE